MGWCCPLVWVAGFRFARRLVGCLMVENAGIVAGVMQSLRGAAGSGTCFCMGTYSLI